MTRDELLDKLAMELEGWPLAACNSGAQFSSYGTWGIDLLGDVVLKHSSGDIGFNEVLQRRAELINKPSWDDAPEWAEWLVQGPDGGWYFTSSVPPAEYDEIAWRDKGYWHRYGKSFFASQGAIPAGHDWRNTLGRRPETIEVEVDFDFDDGTVMSRGFDMVNNPSHYQSDSGIECIDAIRAALGRDGFVAHCRGTAIKYAWRSGKKAAHAEDLRKAAWYLERAAQALEADDERK